MRVPAEIASRIFKEAAVNAKLIFHACVWDYAHARNGRSCGSSGQRVRPLLQEHHDKIQMLLDKDPTASRQQLAPQIHAISDETHHKIHALLTDHQKESEKGMQQREHNGEENRRSAWPATASP